LKEIETKLTVHRAFTLPDLSAAVPDTEVDDGGERALRSTYWDTEDLRLARASITLRSRRSDGDNEGWQLKTTLPVETSGLARLERSIPGHPSRPPREVVDRVAVVTRGARLVPVAKLHTRRGVVEVRQDDRLVAEVVDDEVSVLHGGRVASRFRELEVELGEAGTEQALRSLVGTLLTHGATKSDQRPKVFAAFGSEAEEPDDLDRARGGKRWRAVAAALVDGVRRLRVLDPVARDGEHGAAPALQALLFDLAVVLDVAAPDLTVHSGALAHVAELAGRVAVAEAAIDALDAAGTSLEDAAPTGTTRRRSTESLRAALRDARARRGDRLLEALRDQPYLAAIDACVGVAVGAPPSAATDTAFSVDVATAGAGTATDHRDDGSLPQDLPEAEPDAGDTPDADDLPDADDPPDGTPAAVDVADRPPAVGSLRLRGRRLGRLWRDLTQQPQQRAAAFAVAVDLISRNGTPTKKLGDRAAALAEATRTLQRHREALGLVLRAADRGGADVAFAGGLVAGALARTVRDLDEEVPGLLDAMDGKRLRKLSQEKIPAPGPDTGAPTTSP
jgi:CYTH domain